MMQIPLTTTLVMAALVAATHKRDEGRCAWVAGTSPAMTEQE
jgi:hypothetical protein